MTEQDFVYVDANYLKELEETAKKVDYYKGVIDGINLAIDRKAKPQNYCDDCLYSKTCDSKEFFWACTEKATKKPKDEPQTNADQHVQHVESVEPTWAKEEHEAFYTFLWNVINPNEMQDYIGMFEAKDESQTERSKHE